MVDQTPRCSMHEDGSKIWRQGINLHRLDGPAIEYPDGTKFYYQNDLLHRTDGPAVEYKNSYTYWYMAGVPYSFDEFLELTTISPEDKCMLKLIYG